MTWYLDCFFFEDFEEERELLDEDDLELREDDPELRDDLELLELEEPPEEDDLELLELEEPPEEDFAKHPVRLLSCLFLILAIVSK